jgi:hypothetical protein
MSQAQWVKKSTTHEKHVKFNDSVESTEPINIPYLYGQLWSMKMMTADDFHTRAFYSLPFQYLLDTKMIQT